MDFLIKLQAKVKAAFSRSQICLQITEEAALRIIFSAQELGFVVVHSIITIL